MSNKATHKGTCQVCGRPQKLPGGRLSKHGYTTRCGFFEGVCAGAHHLPFEQDKNLIEGAIKSAKEKAAQIQVWQAVLRAPVVPGVTKAPVRLYYGPRFKGDSGYRWTEVDIYRKDHEGEGGHKWTAYYYSNPSGYKVGVGNHEGNRRIGDYSSNFNSVEEVVAYCNERRAQAEDRQIAEISSYIKWQRERIKDWAPKQLVALDQ